MKEQKPLELYIHIPFCVRKCNYCDFLSAPASAGERQRYVESLCEKIREWKSVTKAYRIISIFVGGGTPSLLEPEQIKMIFHAIYATFVMEKDVEITIEINPGTASLEKLKTYKEVGINRLSIGVQSVCDEELKMLGRIHTFQDFLETYSLAREEGFQNINVDLISAIPGQTIESWKETLQTIAKLEPEHISAYSLIIEENTPFYEWYEKGAHSNLPPLPDEDAERQMYQDTKKILEDMGYHRYEISNYAKAGFECRHNLGYWSLVEYLGIGDGAASFFENQRWTQNEEKSTLSRKEQMEEFMFLGLRKMEGVSKRNFEKIFAETMDKQYGEVIEELKKKSLLEENDEFVFLTEKGIDLSNYVMCEFLIDEL